MTVAELEKVIKGLTCCMDLDNPADSCAKCPYYSKNAYGENDCMRCQLMPDAIGLLKKCDTVEYALSVLRKHGWKETDDVPYPVELLKEQQNKKSKEEVLLAIIGKQSYKDIEKFKKLEELNDEYFNGMLDSIRAVEKLFTKDGEQE